MAGATAERQESRVISDIKNAIKANGSNPITVKAGKVVIKGVVDAYKFPGRQVGGSEPYTDVVIKTNIDEYNCSLKGEAAPSLAGGGLKGLELVVPGIASKFMKTAFDKLNKDLAPGDKVPDVYGKINPRDCLKIVVGNVSMGGPIDYMYIGKMDVVSRYDSSKNILNFENGQLISAEEYARSHKLYFRLRARREDQRFDPAAKDKAGVPKIYGVSPSKGDSAGRIVITDKVPSTAVVINL